MALTTTEMVDERPTALSPQTFFSNVDGDHDHDDYATSLPLFSKMTGTPTNALLWGEVKLTKGPAWSS